MIRQIIPKKLKTYIKQKMKRASLLHDVVPEIMQRAHFFPYTAQSNSYSYMLPTTPVAEPASALVPPPEMWAGYGRTAQEYLDSGRKDVHAMRQILSESGAPLESARRILELGCAAGRLIRWLDDLGSSSEVWGVDIWADTIVWCQQHLSPPFHFATNTVSPHLPFEDGYFDCIYAGSVFTHIADLADAWFLELRRVLRPGGRLFITIADREVAEFNDGKRTEAESAETYLRFGGQEKYQTYVRSLEEKEEYQQFKRHEAGMIVINRFHFPMVMWDTEFLGKRLSPFFRVLSVTPKAYGLQTGLLLERV